MYSIYLLYNKQQRKSRLFLKKQLCLKIISHFLVKRNIFVNLFEENVAFLHKKILVLVDIGVCVVL